MPNEYFMEQFFFQIPESFVWNIFFSELYQMENPKNRIWGKNCPIMIDSPGFSRENMTNILHVFDIC